MLSESFRENDKQPNGLTEKMVLMEMSKIHSSGTRILDSRFQSQLVLTGTQVSESIRQNINELYEQMIDEIRMLKKAASPHPFYRYNTMWSRQMQDAVRLNSCSNPCPASTIAHRCRHTSLYSAVGSAV